jgi:hypothetical protein
MLSRSRGNSGNANASTSLEVDAHLFDGADHGATARDALATAKDALDASYAATLGPGA